MTFNVSVNGVEILDFSSTEMCRTAFLTWREVDAFKEVILAYFNKNVFNEDKFYKECNRLEKDGWKNINELEKNGKIRGKDFI